jgi:hypothetical protein
MSGIEPPLNHPFRACPQSSTKTQGYALGWINAGPLGLMRCRFAGFVALLLALLALFPFRAFADTTASPSTNDWLFVDNGEVRLGVIRSSGAGIAWFSPSESTNNLVNHWDRGRLIQQSYYGDEDGSLWNKQPWRWNPVQGGDWQGKPATVLELTHTTNSLYAKSLARHWASGLELTNVVFEEWISLTGRLAHIRFRMTYSGTSSHAARDHEIPAVFVAPELKTLVLYDGDAPWTGAALSRSQPGWPNESRRMTEHWAAYVGTNDVGLGVSVPVSDHLTCYRFGDGRPDHGSCSYFAPLTNFAITPGKVFTYDVYLFAGNVAEIRRRFSTISGLLPGKAQSGEP